MDQTKPNWWKGLTTEATLKEIFETRVVILDGAMGTVIQKHKLSEEDFRGRHCHVTSGWCVVTLSKQANTASTIVAW